MARENPSKSDIVRFADKYLDFFREEFGRTRESYYRFFDNDGFPSDCRALGFDMDCGHAFINAYGMDAWESIEGIRMNFEKLNDINIIGSGLFSQWRYYNHWAYPSDPDNDIKDWFMILLRRLKILCEKQYEYGQK